MIWPSRMKLEPTPVPRVIPMARRWPRASPLIANRTAIGQWEEFDLIHNGDGSVSLRSHAGVANLSRRR